ncbi:hypothetical protein QR680_006732 [Steinernema hermaphroditum]|uniref:Uncharacterized protein n=1 Tax=Steinernema hermaphroditum TaxID=289476 RepID=A0AA39HWE3_9BILA|nr:hypothetical protein QR680_006732 [Steinernema hermaphroditum]
MNGLPLNFYDALLPMLYMRTIKRLGYLAGRCGTLADEMFKHRYNYELNIENDTIISEKIFNYGRSEFECSTPPQKKFMEMVSIALSGSNEGPVKSDISKRIREVQEHHKCDLVVMSDTVSKNWIDWACSWKGLTGLTFIAELDETAIKLCQQLVDTCKLKEFGVCYEGCGANELTLIKSVLVQDQFETQRLTYFDAAVLEEMFQFCAENSARLKGKKIRLQCGDICDVASKLFEGKLELCSNEESESIEKDHFFFYRTFFMKPSKAYKFSNGESPAYIFFECRGKEREVAELEFFKKTKNFVVLLA